MKIYGVRKYGKRGRKMEQAEISCKLSYVDELIDFFQNIKKEEEKSSFQKHTENNGAGSAMIQVKIVER